MTQQPWDEPHGGPDDGPGGDRLATRWFGSRTTIRAIAWVVIGAMFLVPAAFALLEALAG